MSKQIILAVIIALGLGLGAGYWYASGTKTTTQTTATATDTGPAKKKPLFYRSPMNPSVTSPVPAKDGMGMDYVPVYADKDAGDEPAGTVKIDPVTVQNIGVRSARVEQRTLSRTIQTIGRVDYDEERLTRLNPKTAGWIEKLFINKTGEQVKQGTILLSIYSPKLVTGQQEYLLALNNRETLSDSPYKDIRKGAEDMVRTSRERLTLLDVPEHQIKELEKTRKIKKSLHIHSPFSGIVMKVGVRNGQYVTPKTQLYMIADLSKVWVYVDVYEYELPWVQVGDEVEMRLAGVPGRVFTGRVSYMYPYAEAKTRTIKARLVFDNKEGLLKPDMFADVTIHASRQIKAIVVPSEAIIRSGPREQIFVVRGKGKFEPRDVKLGVSASGMTQILKGVKPGEEVVTSAQFLIDSESKLREATAKMLDASSQDAGSTNASGQVKQDMKMDMNMDKKADKKADMNMDMDMKADKKMDMNMDNKGKAMGSMDHEMTQQEMTHD